MTVFTLRNLKLYFRDRGQVFFSLLAVLIIIVLYAVFLGDVWLSSDMRALDSPTQLMDTWLVAGLMAVVSMTTTMGAFGVLVGDRQSGIAKDFYASPIRRSGITAGYFFAAVAVGMVMSCFALAIGQGYILLNGGAWFSLGAVLKTLALALLATISSGSMVFLLASLLKSVSAFAMASTVVGTLIGFLVGIYLPIGQLPAAVQWVIKVFPVSHAASLFRRILMQDAIATSFDGVPQSFLSDFELLMGVRYEFGDFACTALTSALILAATAIVFYGLSLLSLSKRRAK